MRSQKTPSRWLAPIVLAATLLGFGCGGGNGVMISVKIIYSEAGTDGQGPSDGAAAEVPVGRCCVLAVPDASASDNCSTLARHFLGVSEPCLPARDGGGSMYGQWTCGAAATAAQCTDDGLSCAPGDPCTMPDIGCQGVVAACGVPADGGAPRG